jgi:hypothetical protein
MDALIIWDWDDTLMCSTAINSGRLPGGTAPQLEVLIEEALRISMSVGETMIVTNADDLWVFESTRRFAPRVASLLSQIPIVSARRKFEASYPGDVFAWKRETFREILINRNGGSGLNLVVLGDSPAEIEAASTAVYGLGIHPLLIKTIKFKEGPTCEEVCDQLRMMTQDLSSIVQEDRDCSRNLATRLRGSSFGYIRSEPSFRSELNYGSGTSLGSSLSPGGGLSAIGGGVRDYGASYYGMPSQASLSPMSPANSPTYLGGGLRAELGSSAYSGPGYLTSPMMYAAG